MALNIDRIVRVTAQISPQGVLRRDFGRTLFLTPNPTNILSATGPGKFQTYASIEEVASAGWPTSGSVYRAANVYFQQVPFPKNLIVGQWNQTAVETTFIGVGASLATLAALGANANIGVNVVADGASSSATRVVAAPATTFDSLAAVAMEIQAAFRTISGFAAATVTYNAVDSRFEAEVDPASNATRLSVIITQGTDTISIFNSDGLAGASAESITEALDALEAEEAGFYFVALDSAIPAASMLAVSNWVASRSYMFSADFSSDSSLPDTTLASLDETTDVGRIIALEPERTWATWSRATDDKALSVAARFSSVNFNANNSIITGKFKELPGTLADDLTTTQKDNLDGMRVNHYSPFSGDNIYSEGWTLKPGTFIDVRYWLDWFVNAVQTSVYNLLRTTPGRVPQTPDGIASVRNVVEGVCRQGARNGGIAPGQLTEALAANIRQATGAQEFDGFLSSGYLIHIGDLGTQAQSERAQRRSPPVTVWVKGSGAIHFVDVSITFEN